MKVVPFPMPPKHALDLVREIAGDSSRVHMPMLEEMGPWQEVVTDRQIWLCLHEGTIVQGPAVDSVGEFECTLYRASAGVEVWTRVGVYREKNLAYELYVKEVTTRP